MTGADLELPPLPASARRAVTWWKNNPQIPASYVHNGVVDVDGLERAAWVLVRLGVDVEACLGDTFVIKDVVGFKADLQRSLLARIPGYAIDFPEIADDHVTGRIKTPALEGWSSPLTKRLWRETPIPRDDPDKGWRGDRDLITYAKNNEANYRDKPNRMMEARVTTELIALHAKGVLTGLVLATAGPAVAFTEVQENGGELGPAQVVGESPPGPSSSMATAPDGSTIPAHLRELPVDGDVRAKLVGALAMLEEQHPAEYLWLADICRGLRIPNLRSSRVTQAHAALVGRLIDEALEMVDQPDDIPAAVHDDAPEAAGAEEDQPYRYDPADGEPF